MILLLRWTLGLWPEAVEAVYSNGIFIGLRYLMDYTVGWLPFPVVYLLIALLLYAIVRRLRKPRISQTWPQRLNRWAAGSLRFAILVAAWFMIIWGFNYGRIPVEEKIALAKVEVNRALLFSEAERLSLEAEATRNKIVGADTAALSEVHLPDDLEDKMRDLVAEMLNDLGYHPHGRPRCRLIYPEGFLRHLGIQGIYLPFTGEAHVDGGLPAFIMPFTIAHELAHAYGFTDEGTANFLAWLACQRSDDAFIRYSADFSYFQYVRAEIRHLDPEYYEQFVARMPVGVRADRRFMIRLARRHRTWFPAISEKMNDAYLKSQGVQDGARSYDRLVEMVLAWKARTAS